MIEYQLYETLTLIELNTLASEGWVLVSGADVKTDTDPYIKYAVLEKGGIRSDLNTNVYFLNDDTGANFYLKQEVSYGDLILIILITIILILGVTKAILNFFIPKFVNFRK